MALAFLVDAYHEEEVRGEKRVVLKLHRDLAPLKIAVLPLLKKNDRIVETAIGTAAGLIAGFVFTRPRVQPAEEAIEDLCRKLSGLLTAMADGLAAGSALDAAGGWLARARSLSGEIRRVDDALRQAEESLRLNPRGMRLPYSPITLRQSLHADPEVGGTEDRTVKKLLGYLAPAQVTRVSEGFFCSTGGRGPAFGVRAELDASTDHIKAKIANAERMKVHTMLVIGARDLEANAVSLRIHGQGNLGPKPRDEVIAEILRSIKERRA